MLTCENCGASFEQTGQLTPVTSLRVLCPACAAARAEAKARAARSSEAVTKTIAKGTPSAPRTAAAAPDPAADSRQPPASKSPRAAPKPSAGTPARAETPPIPAREVAKRTAESPRAKPAPKKAPKALHELDPEELHRALKRKGQREILIGIAVVLVIFAAAGALFFRVSGQKKAEADVRAAWTARVDNFKQTFAGMDIESQDGARQLLAYAEEHKSLWSNDEFLAPDVISRTAKAKTFLDVLEERLSVTARIEEIEASLGRASELTPAELAEVRRRLEELAPKAEVGGAELIARVAKDRQDAEATYMARLVSSAEAAAAAEPMDRASLSMIQQAEDEVLKIFEAVTRLWQKNMQDPALTAKKDEYQSRYTAIIKLSDQAVERFFTPEVVEGLPWRDLLASDQEKQWKAAVLKGYEHPIRDGVLRLVGPDPSEKSEGILSIGDRELWRDFVLDMEFTIEKGAMTLFFRIPSAYQENVESLDLTTDEGELEPERSYEFVYSIVASTLVEEEKSEDSLGPTSKAVSWTKIRKGAFAISIPKDTEIRFTRLRAKVLR